MLVVSLALMPLCSDMDKHTNALPAPSLSWTAEHITVFAYNWITMAKVVQYSHAWLLFCAEAKAASQQAEQKADRREDNGTPDGQRTRAEGKQFDRSHGGQHQTEGSGHFGGLQQGSGGKPGSWAGRLKSLFTISGRGVSCSLWL